MREAQQDTRRILMATPTSSVFDADTAGVRRSEFARPQEGSQKNTWWMVPMIALTTSLAWWVFLDFAVAHKLEDARATGYRQGSQDSNAGWARSVEDAYEFGLRQGRSTMPTEP